MALRYESSNKLGAALLEAMGIDRKGVLSLTLHCESGELPTVTLRKAVPQGLAEQAKQLMQLYRLELVATSPLADLDESVCLTSQTHTIHQPAG